MAYFNRFDICEAYFALEYEFNIGGIVKERKRNYSIGVQLDRMKFKPRPSLSGFASLEENAKEIYIGKCLEYGFKVRRFSVWSIDAWANEDGGWTWNDKSHVADIELPPDFSHEDALSVLIDRNVVTSDVHLPRNGQHTGREVVFEESGTDPEIIELQDPDSDNMPIIALIEEETVQG